MSSEARCRFWQTISFKNRTMSCKVHCKVLPRWYKQAAIRRSPQTEMKLFFRCNSICSPSGGMNAETRLRLHSSLHLKHVRHNRTLAKMYPKKQTTTSDLGRRHVSPVIGALGNNSAPTISAIVTCCHIRNCRTPSSSPHLAIATRRF